MLGTYVAFLLAGWSVLNSDPSRRVAGYRARRAPSSAVGRNGEPRGEFLMLCLFADVVDVVGGIGTLTSTFVGRRVAMSMAVTKHKSKVEMVVLGVGC